LVISTSTSAPGLVTSNVWYHAAIVYDSGTMSLYLNGALVDSTAVTFSPPISSDVFRWYRNGDADPRPSIGRFDDFEVRLFDMGDDPTTLFNYP